MPKKHRYDPTHRIVRRPKTLNTDVIDEWIAENGVTPAENTGICYEAISSMVKKNLIDEQKRWLAKKEQKFSEIN